LKWARGGGEGGARSHATTRASERNAAATTMSPILAIFAIKQNIVLFKIENAVKEDPLGNF